MTFRCTSRVASDFFLQRFPNIHVTFLYFFRHAYYTPRSVTQIGEISGRKGAVTQSEDRLCGPVFAQYERSCSLLREEYRLHEPVQRACDNNADCHRHKVKSRTVGLFNDRSCYIIVYFVVRTAYEA
jgi:hypothetical protein